MKILHLLYESKGDYFGIGGVGTRAYEIYSRLKDRHDITLLCRKYPGAKDGLIDGLLHIFTGTESKNLTKALLTYAYSAASFVKKHGVDFDVIIEEFSPAIPTFLSLYKNSPLILQVQGYTGEKYFEKYNILYSTPLYVYEKILPIFYRNFIFVSEESRNKYKLGKKTNIRIIPNGIPENLLGCQPAELNYIAYLGRIDIHHKGLDILIHAYTECYKTFPDIRLIIGGDGRDRANLMELLQKLPEGVRRNIELSGWVEGESKKLLLKNAIMAVMPSRYETQGITALEAMACGKPLVASDIPELGYITSCGAGISFKSGDATSLSIAMKELMTNSKRREMGLKGRAWVREFTWDRIALKYEEFLYSVLGSNT